MVLKVLINQNGKLKQSIGLSTPVSDDCLGGGQAVAMKTGNQH